MKKDLLKDSSGKPSSKRIWGSILLGSGLTFAAILFGFSLTEGAVDAPTAQGVINMFLIAGSSLLGIGVFEKGIKK
jgi:hypothetical protein